MRAYQEKALPELFDARGVYAVMRWRWLTMLVLAGVVAWTCRPCGAEGLVVHEWGTFTSFQDESGRAMHHINTDDEPVPEFVHQLGGSFVFRPTEMPPPLSQGAPVA